MAANATAESKTKLIYDLSLAELKDLLSSWGEKSFRVDQIWQGLYKQFWNTPEQFTTLSKPLKQKIAENLRFSALEPVRELASTDGFTVKTLFRLPDGPAIEAVLMRYDQRRTLCISTQVGCAMNCSFCATGQMGFTRHLTSGEIVEQVIYYARMLAETDERVTNVVIMGMGEPFHNYDATMQAIDILNDHEGFNFGERRFTISTVGLVPMIYKFANEKRQINLAISLHATDNALRSSMIPINTKHPVEELIAACRQYVAQTNRRITFEWALIQGVNDSTRDAKDLADLLHGLLCHVNIIPLNPTHDFKGQASSQKQAQIFQAEMERYHIPCTIRLRRGLEIAAGCGQLASEH
ncbi:MAG: 23S rRNA (adenine(2503)-C(2))-methyltransferase RlmN [Anaerolineaceae bacterium]|jgi:23S rRNA (adenine2503-C2)-methyltransferase|nr:23S rRNA (adenine(2503)-C(2))-methyltransferase RlmN [Anaerolineaceae bacterium]